MHADRAVERLGGDTHHLLSIPGIFTLPLSSHRLGSLTLIRHPFKSSAVSASGSAASPASLAALQLAAFSPAGSAFSMSSDGSSGAEVAGPSDAAQLVSCTSLLASTSVAGV